MSAIRSTAWMIAIIIALVIIVVLGYGSCYNRP
jgi:hypothetical protein